MSLYSFFDSSGCWMPRSEDMAKRCLGADDVDPLSLFFERIEWERPMFLYRGHERLLNHKVRWRDHLRYSHCVDDALLVLDGGVGGCSTRFFEQRVSQW